MVAIDGKRCMTACYERIEVNFYRFLSAEFDFVAATRTGFHLYGPSSISNLKAKRVNECRRHDHIRRNPRNASLLGRPPGAKGPARASASHLGDPAASSEPPLLCFTGSPGSDVGAPVRC